MELFAGTSGFSYPEWRGPFHPADLVAARLLPHHAGRLRMTARFAALTAVRREERRASPPWL